MSPGHRGLCLKGQILQENGENIIGQTEVTTGLILPLPKRFDLWLGRRVLSEQLQLVHLEPSDLLERNKFTDILCNIVETHNPVAGCPTLLSTVS